DVEAAAIGQEGHREVPLGLGEQELAVSPAREQVVELVKSVPHPGEQEEPASGLGRQLQRVAVALPQPCISPGDLGLAQEALDEGLLERATTPEAPPRRRDR